MVEHVVGARFEVKTNQLVAAAKASEEQLAKLKTTAAEADKAVSNLVEGQKSAGKAAAEQAKEIERVEAQLARYLTRIDPASRAVKTQVEGQALLTRALELGIITQAQYETGLVKVTEAANRQRLTTQNLLKGKLSLKDTAGLLGRELGVLAGAFAGTVAGMAASAVGGAALSAVVAVLALGTDELTKAEEALQAVLKKNGDEIEKEKQSAATRLANARAVAAAKRQEAEAILAKVEALKAEAIAQATIEAGMAAGPLTPEIAADIARRAGAPYDAALARARAEIAIDRYTKQPYDDALARRQRLDDNAREVERRRLDAEYKRRFNPDPKTGTGTGTARASSAERDLLRQADAAIKAARALDEYAEASQDIIDKAAAEFAGRRELIAQIELEAQLRKKHGVDYVERNKERIQALAQERAAAQRVADQYKATAQFLENSADRLGDVLDASLVLPFDHSKDAVQNWENTVVNALRQVGAELQRLAITNPLLNALFGGDRQTAYGAGGLVSEIGKWIGGLFSGSGNSGIGASGSANATGAANYQHAGGFAGEGPPAVVNLAAWRNARRYHIGGFAGFGREEVPIIAKRGEGIFTPRQMANADGLFRALAQMAAQGNGGPVVNIIDQRGANAEAVETRTRRGAGGRIEVDVIVREAGKKAIGDGSWDSAMRQRYGVAPKVA